MLAASRNLFVNVSLIKHVRMARFSFAIPLVRDFYFVLIGVFIVLCFIAFLVFCVIFMCCNGVINDNNMMNDTRNKRLTGFTVFARNAAWTDARVRMRR